MEKDKQSKKTFEESLQAALHKGKVTAPSGLFDQIHEELEENKKPLILYWLSAASVIILFMLSFIMFEKGTGPIHKLVQQEIEQKRINKNQVVIENKETEFALVEDEIKEEFPENVESIKGPSKTPIKEYNKSIPKHKEAPFKTILVEQETLIAEVKKEELKSQLDEEVNTPVIISQDEYVEPNVIVASLDEDIDLNVSEDPSHKKTFSSFSDVKNHMMDKIADGENVAFAYNSIPSEDPDLKNKRKLKLKIKGFQFKASF